MAASGFHDPYVFCFSTPTQPDCQVSGNQATFNNFMGSTAVASAAFAGIMALVDQAVGGRQGLANYGLYSLAAAESADFGSCNSSNQTDPTQPPGPQCVFNDITTGNNGVAGNDTLSAFVPPGDFLGQAGYNAVAGYDPASGLGSVNAATLVNAWVSLANSFQGSTTTLSASFNGTPLPSDTVTITHGQPVSVTVSVARQGTTGTPIGTVALIAQGGNLPASNVGIAGELLSGSGGTATAGPVNVNNLPGGTNYDLLASFPGDGVFAGSTSNAINVSVQPENTSTTLQSFIVHCSSVLNQPGPCLLGGGTPGTTMDYGDPRGVLFIEARTVGVSGLIPASGNVTFAFGNNAISPIPIDNSGSAEVGVCFPPLTACLLPGQYAVTATYNGDGPLSYNPGGSTAPLNITVTKGNPLVHVIAPLGIGVGTAFTLGAQIQTGLGTVVPSGTVQFFDGTNPPAPLGGSLTLSGGQASMQVTFTTPGDHEISVQYSGDNTYNAATEAFEDIIVLAVPFTLTATTTSQTIAAGQTATYNVSLNPAVGFAGQQVSLSCTGAPSGATCTVSPNPAVFDSRFINPPSIPLTVTVSNTANAALAPPPLKILPLVFAGVLGVMVLGLKRRPRQQVLVLLAAFLVVAMSSCGGGGGVAPQPTPTPTPTSPPTTATLTVTGTSGANTNSITLSLTVTH